MKSLSWDSKQQKLFNQEDSLYFNKSAIERGLFKSTSLKKFKVEIQKNQSTSQDDVFMKPIPDEVTGLRYGSYDKLNDKGYVSEETTVYNGDIIMAKLTPIQPVEGSNKKYKDSSVPYIAHAPGVIDKVYTNIYNNEGFEMRKMRVRSERIPQTGDKFASRHGLKILAMNRWQ
jgi:DNA-directed RNA polymerase II subunit RPB2